MAQKKYTIFTIIFLIVLVATVVVSLGYTFAWFTDKENVGPITLTFGSVKINLGENSTGGIQPASVEPGGNIFANDITFNLDESSSACYVRAKYKAVNNAGGGC